MMRVVVPLPVDAKVLVQMRWREMVRDALIAISQMVVAGAVEMMITGAQMMGRATEMMRGAHVMHAAAHVVAGMNHATPHMVTTPSVMTASSAMMVFPPPHRGLRLDG